MSLVDDFRRWNDEMAEKYNPDRYHRASVLPIRVVERYRVRVLLRQADVRPSQRLLEIGCGAGNVLERVTGGEVVGVDLSRKLLNLAQRRAYSVPCQLAQSYGEALPFASSTFDRVICTEVLEHVREPRSVCEEAHRVLKPGGRFVFSVPNEAAINAVKSLMRSVHLDRVIHRISGYRFASDMTDEWHLHAFSPALAREVARGLFVVERVQHVPMALLPLRIVVSCRKTD